MSNAECMWVCCNCTADAFLKNHIRSEAAVHECSYGASTLPCISLRDLALLMDPIYREHYEPVTYGGTGDYPEYIVQEILEVEPPIMPVISCGYYSISRAPIVSI